MASGANRHKRISRTTVPAKLVTSLRVGDPVMVLQGGNSKKQKVLRGKVGKILRFLPKKDRVVVEGVNLVKRHKRALTSQDTSGIIEKEGSVHISNVMFFSEEHKRPFRLCTRVLNDGRKVRGFVLPDSKKFHQVDM